MYADDAFAFDFGLLDDKIIVGDASTPRASAHVRAWGEYNQGALTTRERQVPDRFGQHGVAFEGEDDGPRAIPHVRTWGAYDQGAAVTREGQYPDRFGKFKAEFSYDGLGAEPPVKTVADVKRLCDVVAYRLKMLQPAVYAIPDFKPDYGPLRADFERFKGRVMHGLKKAQAAIVACAKSATAKECDVPADSAYDALVTAMRQGGAPDSPIQRGDYDDLVRRVEKAGGHIDLAGAPEFGHEPPSFGDNIVGQKSIADLKDLLATWDASMASLKSAADSFLSTWTQYDPASASDWSNDWAGLQQRYAKARADAQSAIDASSSTLRSILSLGTSNMLGDQQGAQVEYDEVLTAIKQSHQLGQAGGGSISKGDYDDLLTRINAAQKSAGAAVTAQAVVQPTAPDPGLSVLKATQGVDVIGGLTGQFHSPMLNAVGSWFGINSGQPGGPPPGAHAQAILVFAAIATGGYFALKLFVMPTVKAAVGLGSAIVGGYVGYKTIGVVAPKLSQLGSSPGAKLLGF